MSSTTKWIKAHRRPLTRWGIVVVIIVLLALPSIGSDDQPLSLDPTSTKPDGTKAFALLMQQAGATFSVSNKAGGTAILLQDTLSRDEADNVHSWVQAGGTLIVADPASSLSSAQLADDSTVRPKVLKPQCSAPDASGVSSIRPNTSADYRLFSGDDDPNVKCFPYKSGYFLVEHVVGAGKVIDVGSPTIFENQNLANFDNAVMLTNLVDPSPTNSITWLETQDVDADSGSSASGSSLMELLPTRVRESFWQLAIAALLLALWRGRRLGQPVDEEQLVEIPASQLIAANGNLLETAGRSEDAARLIRRDLKRNFAQLLGVTANIPDEALVQMLHERTGVPVDRLEAVLFRAPADDNTQLIQLSQQVEYLYLEVARVR